jgi:hypothetical protein
MLKVPRIPRMLCSSFVVHVYTVATINVEPFLKVELVKAIEESYI